MEVKRRTTEKIEVRLSLEELTQLIEKNIEAFAEKVLPDQNVYYDFVGYNCEGKMKKITQLTVIKEKRTDDW